MEEQNRKPSPTEWGRDYTFSDALHRVRMNITTYAECFSTNTPQSIHNERLLTLIDAASDMLLALQTALACLENLQEVQIWEEDQGDHIEEGIEAIEAIQAAIRKATNQWAVEKGLPK